MKKILCLLISLLLIAGMLSACTGSSEKKSSVSESNLPSGNSSATVAGSISDPAGSDPSTPSSDDTVVVPADSIFTTVNVQNPEKKEHKELKELPVRATLVGSDTLPAIDNQGSVGSCSSNAIAYTQFTNAVAQYLKSKEALTLNTQNYEDCFSPKFTFQYAGASTSNVYNLLMEQGCLTNKVDPFAKDAGGGSVLANQKTMRWEVSEGMQIGGLQYRLSGYEQTFVTGNPDFTVPGKSGVAMTTSEAGRAMMKKIKEAIATGNVVVTGGYPSSWVDTRMPAQSDADSLAKSGDRVITYANDNRSGGHQVCIVAYDDEITVSANGVTMKGAFLIANSWGTSYGKDGYCWIMYDALNSVSEHEGFKLTGLHKDDVRDWPLDQFCFVYWDRDVVEGAPELYAEVEVEISNRENMSMEVSRTDASGQTITVKPYMFDYTGARPGYDNAGKYLNMEGVNNGEATTGFFALSFERLFSNMPEGMDFRNYSWSVKVSSSSDSTPVTVKSVKLYSKNEKLYTIDLGEGEVLSKTSRTYTFDFGGNSSVSIYNGSYTFKNVATGEYLVKNQVMNFKNGAEKDALEFHVVFDILTNTYKIRRNDDRYVVDAMISDRLKDGTEVRFNAESPLRTGTQQWNLSYNEDGTVSFYLKDEKGAGYALAMVDGGAAVVKATELTDSIKWMLAPAGQTATAYLQVNKTDQGLTVNGLLRKADVSSVTLTVKKADGSTVTTKEVSVESKQFSVDLPLTESGTYFISATNTATGAPECGYYVIAVG